MEKIIPWSVEQYSDFDFKRLDDIIEKPSCNFLNTWKIQYNQDEVHKSSCFAHWPFTAISALTGYKFTLEERKAIVEEAWTKDWADPAWGWKFVNSCQFIAKWYNKNRAKSWQWLEFYRIPKSRFKDFNDKGYLVVTWYIVEQWNAADRNDDWIYNNSKWWYWKEYWGHCICKWIIDWKDVIVDNYAWKRVNIIEWYEALKEYQFWYVFMLKEDVKDWYQWLSLEDKEKKLRNR